MAETKCTQTDNILISGKFSARLWFETVVA